MQIRPGNGAVALTAGLAAAILLGPLLLRGDPTENARLEANRRRIAEMTEANRQKLLRNFADWQAMSLTQQRQWQEFSQQLQLQQATLGPVVEDYYTWLQTIPGYRRDQLRQAQDAQQKVGLVREIVQEELAERLDAPEEETVGLAGREMPVLTGAELDSVFAALEDGLSKAERDRLVDKAGQSLVGVERHLMVMSQLFRFGGVKQVFENASNRTRVFESLPERVREELGRLPERTAVPLMMVLVISLKLELDRAFRSAAPTSDELLKFYETQLTPAEQEQLLNLSAHDLREELMQRRFRSQLEQRLTIDMQKVEGFLNLQRGQGPPNRPRTALQLGGGGPFRGDAPPGQGDRPPGGFGRPPEGGDRPRGPLDGERPQNGDRRPPRDGQPPEAPPR